MKRCIAILLASAALAAVTACSTSTGANDRLRVVASVYPLAWAARSLAPDAEVTDLTPPGGEPHDLQLTARQRLAIQEADVVLVIGDGFQPDVERAAKDAKGQVTEVRRLLAPPPSVELRGDPHVWLDPELMRQILGLTLSAFGHADEPNHETYLKRMNDLSISLDRVVRSYRQTLATCDLTTIVTTHEAFGYLAQRFGLRQRGLTGLTPEAEPSAKAIAQARDLARRGVIAAIFYESSDEGARIGKSVARDIGVRALPLSTLEHAPPNGDYITEMTANLAQLKVGLRCR